MIVSVLNHFYNQAFLTNHSPPYKNREHHVTTLNSSHNLYMRYEVIIHSNSIKDFSSAVNLIYFLIILHNLFYSIISSLYRDNSIV